MDERGQHEQLVPSDLGVTDDECDFLIAAISQFGGPASVTTTVARFCSFDDVGGMREGLRAIHEGLRLRDQLSRAEWYQAMAAAELSFGSDFHGAGVEWQTVTGRDDCESLAVLRGLQQKLVSVCPQLGRD